MLNISHDALPAVSSAAMGEGGLMDYWWAKLAMILLGYGSVILPAYCLIRLVERKYNGE